MTLRSRHPAHPEDEKTGDATVDLDADDDPASTRISLLDIVRVIAGLLVLSAALSYIVTSNSYTWNYRPAFTRPERVKAWWRGPLSLTPEQLALYNGTSPDLPVLLALNGTIYDVSAGRRVYGPGGMYHFFSGRDATRAFVTGCFQEDLTGDLRGVEEMFMPIDADEDGERAQSLGKEGRKERKLKRERELRVARKQVWETVEGWRKTYDGGKDGKYFKVGTVKREGDWGPRRELCEQAKSQRPKREEGKEIS